MKKFLTISLFCMLNLLLFSATTLKVEYLSGEDYSIALSALGRIELTGDKFLLVSHTGEILIEKTSVYDVDKIVFTNDNSDVAIDETISQHIVYPNPTNEALCIENVIAGQIIRIFSLDGRLLSTTEATADGLLTLNLSTFSQGTYFLQIDTQITKIIKQ